MSPYYNPLPLLLLTLPLLPALPQTNLSCRRAEECVPENSCREFKDQKALLSSIQSNTSRWKTLVARLREAVCNKKEKGVCCEINPAVGRSCLTVRGDEGSCQDWARCPASDSFYSGVCGTEHACCRGKETRARQGGAVLRNPARTPPGRPKPRGLCGQDGSETYVFGGKKAKDGQFPFVASLVKYNRRTNKVRSFCGGVLITSRHILTAAHCFTGITERDLQDDDIDVRVGLTNLRAREKPGNSANIASVTSHENYGKIGVGVENDIAIITLDRDTDGPTVCLPEPGQYRSWANRSAVIVGWGRITQSTSGPSETELRYANLQEYTLRDCQQKYDRFLARNAKKAVLTNKQLCAGNEEADACNGDSGGPLLHLNRRNLWMVAGIVSFGPAACAQEEVPGIYTKVASYLDWINRVIGL